MKKSKIIQPISITYNHDYRGFFIVRFWKDAIRFNRFNFSFGTLIETVKCSHN